MHQSPTTLTRPPLHAALGARFTGFAGWSVPLRHGEAAAHRAVRERAGLFDLGHLGQTGLRGPKR
ncbi:hypothetical protein OG559_24985 [Micromonospora sp. NBC_01405]|uniref:hypothetical protein n=1 Tax=Micromonospora sp. NBC_01405 TaxID=2903589 RepID=UPI0032565FD6